MEFDSEDFQGLEISVFYDSDHFFGYMEDTPAYDSLSKRIRDVVFDYKNTYFMDSSGIGLVMGRYREVRYLKGDIYITCVNGKVARILEISGLYRVAKTAEAVEDALDLIEAKYCV